MTILWKAALAAPPIEENPISVEGPTAILPTSPGFIRAVVAADLDTDGHSDIVYGQANLLRIQQNVGITTTEWAQTVTVGSATYDIRDVQTVDLDRDGVMDLISASADDAGNSQFRLWQNPTSPFASSWSVSNTLVVTSAISLTTVASADLDGNGTPDVVSGGLDGVLRLWSNPLTGTQGFVTSWPLPAIIPTPGDQVRQVLITDIDRDGLPDIIEAAGDGSSGAVRLWQNPGDPFSTVWTVSNTLGTFTVAAQSLSVGDLDNNGTPDVVVGLSDGQVVAWSNPIVGSQAFTTAWGSSSVGSLSLSVAGLVLTDGDHDGQLDIVATGSGTPSTLVGWRNTGQPFGGGWSQVIIGTPSDVTSALTAADFNHDGDEDFVTASGNTGTNTGGLQFWTNVLIRSSMRFQTPGVSEYTAIPLEGVGLHAMDVHDMDRDGLPDIVVATLDGSLILLRNDGLPFSLGTWQAIAVGNSLGFFAVVAGDLDGDGWPDIATSTTLTDGGGLLHIWRNDGTPFTGSWISQTAETFPRQVMDLALGDIAREGHLQIVASTGITTSFEYPSEHDVITSADNRIWLLRPPAGDVFASPWISSTVCTTTYSANSISVGDLDSDGWADVVFGTDHAPHAGPDPEDWPNAYQVRACQNLGAPYSSAGWQAYDVGRDDAPVSVGFGHEFWGAHVWVVAVGDLNNDGYLDVVSGGGPEGDYQIVVYKNDGTPFDGNTWQPTAIGYGSRFESGSDCVTIIGGTYPEDCPWLETSITAVDVGDLNGDGWLDVVSGFGAGLMIMPLWINTGAPFGEVVTDTHWIRYDLDTIASRPVYGVEATDLDNDGRLDVAAVTSWLTQHSPASGPLRVWRNLGGIARHDFQTDYTVTTIENGATESRLSFAIKHNGRLYDHDLEIDFLKIHLLDQYVGIPMTNDQAHILFQSLQIYRDVNGDNVWQPSDSPVITLTTFSLDSTGYQTLTFPSDDPLAAISPGQTVTYFVVLEMQPTASQPANPSKDNSFRMDYVPHEATLIRDRVTQASVSLEEGAWTYTPWIHPVPAPAASVVMTASPSMIWASGTSTSTITATVTTAYGYPVLDGTTITFTTSTGFLPASPYTTTTTDGVATAVLTSSTELTTTTVTGTVSITATGTTTVEFRAGPRASLRINDAPGIGGNEVVTHTMPSTDTFTVYVAVYDALDRFMDNPADVTWGGSGVVTGYLSPTTGVSSTTFTPGLVGSGTITVTDGTYSDATDTITVANTAPEFISTPVTAATEDVTYTYNITATDVDAGDVLTITAPTLPPWLTLTDNGDGSATLDGTPANTEVGDHSVELQVEDSAMATDSQVFTITVANTNDAPEFTSTPVTAATEELAYTYHITATDVDAGDLLTITAPTLPLWLTLTDNGDGSATLNGTPTNDDVGDHGVELQVKDAAEATGTQAFTITVANTNDAPEFTSTPVTAAAEGVAYTYHITATDVDAGDLLTITAPTSPPWLTLTDNGDGSATLNGTPANDDVGDHGVELQVKDSAMATDTQVFTITVEAAVATTIMLEDAADGSGSVIGDRTLTAGESLTVYAVARNGVGNFVGNVAVNWSLTGKSGGVADGDLTPAGDGKSAIFTGKLVGSAHIRAQHATLGSGETGIVNVTPGPLVGFGLDVPASGIAGQPFTMTITARDLFSNTITNFAEDVSLSTTNGGIISPTVARGTDFTAGVWTGPITLSEAGQDRIITVSVGDVSNQTTIDLALADDKPYKIFLPLALRNH